MECYNKSSRTPYGAAADIFLFDQDGNDSVTIPGYVNPPVTAVYFFTEPDAFRTAAMYRTDLALNYSRKFGSATPRVGRLRSVPLPEPVQSVPGIQYLGQRHRHDGLDGGQRYGPRTCAVQSVYGDAGSWHALGVGRGFRQAHQKDAYTLPRTYRFSVGLKF